MNPRKISAVPEVSREDGKGVWAVQVGAVTALEKKGQPPF